MNLVFLKYVTADELQGVIKNFIGEYAQIFSYPPANLLDPAGQPPQHAPHHGTGVVV